MKSLRITEIYIPSMRSVNGDLTWEPVFDMVDMTETKMFDRKDEDVL